VHVEALRGQWFTGREGIAQGLVDEVGDLAGARAAALALAALLE
jgi:ClpP class serine protease